MTAAPGASRGGAVLYTPELLSLAVSLAQVPFDPTMPLAGESRSRTCGSTVRISLSLDAEARVERIGLQVTACAVGQAAAAIFARSAIGRDLGELRQARSMIADWLSNGSDVPAWPGLEALAAAREYPARHGAILLSWDAALAALSNTGSHR